MNQLRIKNKIIKNRSQVVQQQKKVKLNTNRNNSTGLESRDCQNLTVQNLFFRTQQIKQPSNKANTLSRRKQKDETDSKLWFGRITQHCLRRSRQKWLQNCRVLESQYKYIMKKQSSQKKRQIKQSRQRIFTQTIRQQRLNQIQLNKKIKEQNQNILRNRIIRLKQKVINHKKNKDYSRTISYEQKAESAHRQRLKSMQILSQKKQLDNSRLYENQSMCYRQRQQAYKHKVSMNKIAYRKRHQAKEKFKEKWVTEMQKNQQAKEQYQQKRKFFQQKLRSIVNGGKNSKI